VAATYHLQFLSEQTANGTTVIFETTVTGGVDAAIKYAAEVEWPPTATALRLVDLDGRDVYERTKINRS
jgi:hypothetical protein